MRWIASVQVPTYWHVRVQVCHRSRRCRKRRTAKPPTITRMPPRLTGRRQSTTGKTIMRRRTSIQRRRRSTRRERISTPPMPTRRAPRSTRRRSKYGESGAARAAPDIPPSWKKWRVRRIRKSRRNRLGQDRIIDAAHRRFLLGWLRRQQLIRSPLLGCRRASKQTQHRRQLSSRMSRRI
jgi:hypothetical protein